MCDRACPPDKMERDFGLDLTRAAAALLVLSVHFFRNAGFYAEPLAGAGMAANTVARMACMTCVPLFIMLTGYLCVHRRWTPGYLWKLTPVLTVWILAGTACLAFRILWLGEQISPMGMVRRLLDFSAAPYGWYVEMYIGLFLLAPFFNAAWNSLDERGRERLTAVLLFLTAIPLATNLFYQILPDWWTGRSYPLTYYALGALLRERPIRAKSRWLLLGWLGSAAAGGLLKFWLDHGEIFAWALISDWGSPFVIGEAVCLFSLLSRCRGERAPRWLRWCIERVSRLFLPIYLMSYITDQVVYPPLCRAVPSVPARLPFLPVMALLSLLLSGLMAQAVDWLAGAADRALNSMRSDHCLAKR